MSVSLDLKDISLVHHKIPRHFKSWLSFRWALQDFPRNFLLRITWCSCTYLVDGKDNLNKNNGSLCLLIKKSWMPLRWYSVYLAFCDGWAQMPDGRAQIIDDWAQARSGPPLATPLRTIIFSTKSILKCIWRYFSLVILLQSAYFSKHSI